MGQAPGRDGWRFEHLKVLLDKDHSSLLILKACNSYVAGSLPDSIAAVLVGAKLIALNKILPRSSSNCCGWLYS